MYIVDLQYCVNFCSAAKWLTYVLCSVVQSFLMLQLHGLCSPTSSTVHRILQARILEWVAISSSRGSSWPMDQTCVSCISYIGRQILYHCVTNYICSFLYCFPLWFIPGHWMWFCVLYSRTLLSIHSMCNSLHLLTLNSQSTSASPLSPLATYLTFSGTPKLFCLVAVSFYILTWMYEVSKFSHSLQHLLFSRFFTISILMGVKRYSHCISISPMINAKK